MEPEKKKQLEAKLREMMALAGQTQQEERAIQPRPTVAKVIRRRKGQPDKHIA